MKLTGWFSQDKIADNSRVQTPNNANTEQVNRQIRALVPGQTLRGEVVSREGNNAQIRLLQDVLVDAKVDARYYHCGLHTISGQRRNACTHHPGAVTLDRTIRK